MAAHTTDPELEFDREVYPIGISIAEVAIIGPPRHCFTCMMLLASYVVAGESTCSNSQTSRVSLANPIVFQPTGGG